MTDMPLILYSAKHELSLRCLNLYLHHQSSSSHNIADLNLTTRSCVPLKSVKTVEVIHSKHFWTHTNWTTTVDSYTATSNVVCKSVNMLGTYCCKFRCSLFETVKAVCSITSIQSSIPKCANWGLRCRERYVWTSKIQGDHVYHLFNVSLLSM